MARRRAEVVLVALGVGLFAWIFWGSYGAYRDLMELGNRPVPLLGWVVIGALALVMTATVLGLILLAGMLVVAAGLWVRDVVRRRRGSHGAQGGSDASDRSGASNDSVAPGLRRMIEG